MIDNSLLIEHDQRNQKFHSDQVGSQLLVSGGSGASAEQKYSMEDVLWAFRQGWVRSSQNYKEQLKALLGVR
jgi:hypothetical protein